MVDARNVRQLRAIVQAALGPRFLLDITHFIELTINSIDMLGKAGWVFEEGLLEEATRGKLRGSGQFEGRTMR